MARPAAAMTCTRAVLFVWIGLNYPGHKQRILPDWAGREHYTLMDRANQNVTSSCNLIYALFLVNQPLPSYAVASPCCSLKIDIDNQPDVG